LLLGQLCLTAGLGLGGLALEGGDVFGMLPEIVFEFRNPLIGAGLSGGQSGLAAPQVALEIGEAAGLFLDFGALGGQLLLASGQGVALLVELSAILAGGRAIGGQAGVEIALGGSEVLLAVGKFAARLFEADPVLGGDLLLGGDVLSLGQEALLLDFEGGAVVGQGLALGVEFGLLRGHGGGIKSNFLFGVGPEAGLFLGRGPDPGFLLGHLALEGGDVFGLLPEIVFEFRGQFVGTGLSGGQVGLAAVQVALEVAEVAGLLLDFGALGG
jgi:hypothetical protein